MKLSAEQIVTLRAEYASGDFTQKDLAIRFGVSQPLISYYVGKRKAERLKEKCSTGAESNCSAATSLVAD